MRSSVDTALADAGALPARDAAAAELAQTYADLIDRAAPTTALSRAIEVMAGNVPDDEKAADAWRKITSALAEHSVMSDLGPKLLATLEALQLTPRARALTRMGGKQDEPAVSVLDQLAAARRAKSAGADRAAGVHSAG